MVVVVRHKTRAIDQGQLIGAKGMVWGATATEPAVETEHPITGAPHHLQIVRHLQNRPALPAAQLIDEAMEGLTGLGVQASLGLIQQQEAAGTHHAEGQQHPFELAA